MKPLNFEALIQLIVLFLFKTPFLSSKSAFSILVNNILNFYKQHLRIRPYDNIDNYKTFPSSFKSKQKFCLNLLSSS